MWRIQPWEPNLPPRQKKWQHNTIILQVADGMAVHVRINLPNKDSGTHILENTPSSGNRGIATMSFGRKLWNKEEKEGEIWKTERLWKAQFKRVQYLKKRKNGKKGARVANIGAVHREERNIWFFAGGYVSQSFLEPLKEKEPKLMVLKVKN